MKLSAFGIAAMVFVAGFVLGQDCIQTPPPEQVLKEKGYDLSIRSLRSALSSKDPETRDACLAYAVNSRCSDLAPDVRRYRKKLDLKLFHNRMVWLVCTTTLFTIDDDMSSEQVANDMVTLREYMQMSRESGAVPGWVLDALIAAQKYKGEEIRTDLLYLAMNTTWEPTAKASIAALFDLYGKALTGSDVRSLKERWQGSKPIQSIIDNRSREFGISPLLETPSAGHAVGDNPVNGEGARANPEGTVKATSGGATEDATRPVETIILPTEEAVAARAVPKDAVAGKASPNSTEKIVVICVLGAIAACIILGNALYRRHRRQQSPEGK